MYNLEDDEDEEEETEPLPRRPVGTHAAMRVASAVPPPTPAVAPPAELDRMLTLVREVKWVLALMMRLQKVLVQHVSDQGGWDAAILLGPCNDPLQAEQSGGTEEEMRRVASDIKAVGELKSQQKARPNQQDSFEAEDPLSSTVPAGEGKGGRKRDKGGGRGRGGQALAVPE